MRTLRIPPDSDSYSWSEAVESRSRNRTASGRVIQRQDHLTAHRQLSVQWTLNQSKYLYITSFYESAINRGIDPFFMELITDHPSPELHTCQIIEGINLVEHSGHFYLVSAVIDVEPLQVDHELNQLRLLEFERDPKIDLLSVAFRPLELLQSPQDKLLLVGEEQTLDLKTYVNNPNLLAGVDWSSSTLPSGLELNEDGVIIGTVSDLPADYPIVVAGRVRDTEPVLIELTLLVRPNDYLGIGDMQIGTTFIVGENDNPFPVIDRIGNFVNDLN